MIVIIVKHTLRKIHWTYFPLSTPVGLCVSKDTHTLYMLYIIKRTLLWCCVWTFTMRFLEIFGCVGFSETIDLEVMNRQRSRSKMIWQWTASHRALICWERTLRLWWHSNKGYKTNVSLLTQGSTTRSARRPWSFRDLTNLGSNEHFMNVFLTSRHPKQRRSSPIVYDHEERERPKTSIWDKK